MSSAENVKLCTSLIAKRAPGFKPKLAIILGSGMEAITNQIENPIAIDFKELPGFFVGEVAGDAKRVILGNLKGTIPRTVFLRKRSGLR